MNLKTILIWVGSVVAVFLILFFAYNLTATPQKLEFPELNKVRADDHTTWSKDNKNLLIEYSDIQCPACKGFHDLFKTFEATTSPDFAITQKVTLVYRHFPLFQIHPNAFKAAYAAEAASNQDKFWEMTNVLYNKQSEWSGLADPSEFFTNLAAELKLDVEKFKTDSNSQKVIDRVQLNLAEAEKSGFNSTPTFILNGKPVNVRTMEEFKQLLNSL